MNKLLSLLFTGALLVAPSAATADDKTYTGCVIQEQAYACHLTNTASLPNAQEYQLRTIGDQVNLSFECDNTRSANIKTPGRMVNLNNNKAYNIECSYNVSTRSSRSITVYNQGTWDAIFSFPLQHTVGR